jgi:hypothetical protein
MVKQMIPYKGLISNEEKVIERSLIHKAGRGLKGLYIYDEIISI